jgi:hypothetical protein
MRKLPQISTAGRSNLLHHKAVFGERNFAHFTADFLFFPEEVSDNHLAVFRSNEIDRLKQQFFFVILFYISL